MKKVNFKKIPYDPDDETADNYIGISADDCFEIEVDEKVIGILYLSYNRYFPDENDPRKTYIEWIEFFSVYRNKHLLKPVMKVLVRKYGDVYFESSKDTTKKYDRIGCEILGVDKYTGLTKFVLKAVPTSCSDILI